SLTVCSPTAAYSFFAFFFFYHPAAPPDLHSFPTRRSSDLPAAGADAAGRERRAGDRCERSVDVAVEAGDGVGVRSVVVHIDVARSEEHTSELQSLAYLVCRLLLEKKKKKITNKTFHTICDF